MEANKSVILFPCPALHAILGSSMVGKTDYTKRLCLNANKLFASPVVKIIYAYEIYQEKFRELEKIGVEFHQGLPTEDQIQKWNLLYN